MQKCFGAPNSVKAFEKQEVRKSAAG